MTERVEEIVAILKTRLGSVYTSRGALLDTASAIDALYAAALAQAERERDDLRAALDKMAETAASERAEVERLKGLVWAALDEIGKAAIAYQPAEKRIKRIIAIYKRAALEGR